MAACATTRPWNEFKVETIGCGWPVGHSVRYESAPGGTTVTFSEYAWAVAGMTQPLSGIANERVEAAVMAGPPNAPGELRVSATRQGVTGTNRNAPSEMVTVCPATVMTPERPAPVSRAAWIVTLPSPEPDDGPVNVTQSRVLDADQGHPLPAVTGIVAEPPASEKPSDTVWTA